MLWNPAQTIETPLFWNPAQTVAWASYQIRKIAGCACAGNAGNVSPRRRLQRKTLVSDPVMHHGTCVTHVPWCMSGSLTSCGGETFPAFPAHAHPQFYVSGKRPIPRADFQWVEVNTLNIEMQGLHGICYFVHVLKDTEQSSGVICEP